MVAIANDKCFIPYLCCDKLQSDTCAVRIPELELELEEGTLGGRFTTIEGLLTQVKEQVIKPMCYVR